MQPRHSFLFAVIASISAGGLIGACAAPLAQPTEQTISAPTTAAATIQQDNSRLATEAPVEATAHPQGTPPGFPTVVIKEVVTDPLVIALLAEMQHRGFTPELRDASRVDLLQDAPGQSYRLGDGWLYLHVYPNALAAKAAATALPNDVRVNIDWVAPPHFFQCDRLIALYLGLDERIIGTLSELCAPPFYTTNLQPLAPVATRGPLTTVEAALAWLVSLSEPRPTSATEVLQTVKLDSGVALLFTYAAVQANHPVLVTGFSYLDWRDPVWYPDGDHIDVVSGEAALPPIQFLAGSYVVKGGTDTPQLPDRIAFAGGRVNDRAIQTVRVIFSDNSPEVVPVEHGAYLAAKLDVERVVSIEALDQTGQVVYQFTSSP